MTLFWTGQSSLFHYLEKRKILNSHYTTKCQYNSPRNETKNISDSYKKVNTERMAYRGGFRQDEGLQTSYRRMQNEVFHYNK